MGISPLDEYLIVSRIERALKGHDVKDPAFVAVEIFGQIVEAVETALTRRSEPTPYEPWIGWEGKNTCSACGLALEGVMNYCCPQPKCPTGLGGPQCQSTLN